MSDPVRELQEQLLRDPPALEPWLAAARSETGEPPRSEYWLFRYVVRPYLEATFVAGSEADLALAWSVLEGIAVNGSASAKNELLVVTMEELDLSHFYRFMGPALRRHWFDHLAWYPQWRTRTERTNTHVDKQRLRERWTEEIERIGGFERLTSRQRYRIEADLWHEFGIKGT